MAEMTLAELSASYEAQSARIAALEAQLAAQTPDPTKYHELQMSATEVDTALRSVADHARLGGSSKYLTADDDLDTVWENGFYAWDAAPKNAPVSYGSMLSLNKGSAYISHQLIFAADGSKIQRTRYGETIKQWKWIDPSMMLGVEYLTDKYYLGKPVYAKVVSCGAMANGKVVELVSSAFRILNVRLKGNPDLFPLVPKDSVLTGWQGGFYAGGRSITLYAGDNLAAANHEVNAIVQFIDA